VLLHPLDPITESVRARLAIPQPPVIADVAKELAGQRVFLVDHNHPDESAGREVAVRVVGIIDHHTDSGYPCDDKEVRPVGSAAQLVVERMVRCGFPNAEQDRRVIAMAMTALAIDTAVGMKARTSDADRALLRRWCETLGVSEDELKLTCLFEIDLHDPVAIASNARKDFVLAGHRVRTAYVELLTEDAWKNAAVASAVRVLESEVSRPECEFDLAVLVVRHFASNFTAAPVVGRLAQAVLRVNGNKALEFNELIMRTEVVEQIRKILETLNKEDKNQC